MTSRRYLVTVEYREPTFERRTHRRAEPFRGTFTVDAPNREAAVSEALRQFREWERLSSVNWVRQVVRASCTEVGLG